MDKIVGAIQGLSSTEQDLKTLRSILSKEENTIVKHLPYLDEVLQFLDPSAHSLGYAFILYDGPAFLLLANAVIRSVKAAGPGKFEAQKFVLQVQRLIAIGSAAQLRLVPSRGNLSKLFLLASHCRSGEYQQAVVGLLLRARISGSCD